MFQTTDQSQMCVFLFFSIREFLQITLDGMCLSFEDDLCQLVTWTPRSQRELVLKIELKI